MSNSTWGESEINNDETVPSSLLKSLLKHMMAHFVAQGGCIALLDESIGEMRVQLHLRTRSSGGLKPPSRRMSSVHLQNDGGAIVASGHTNLGRMRSLPPPLPEVEEDVDELIPQATHLFPRGSTYAYGVDLIGRAWQKNEAYAMTYEQYIVMFQNNIPFAHLDIVPTSLLVVPVRTTTLIEEAQRQKPTVQVMGVVVLYQTIPGINPNVLSKQRREALDYVERIALYLQNLRLRQAQQRTNTYLQRLQETSTAFPSGVQLSDLVQHVYDFTSSVVDVSAMLLTLYDRDTERIYDIFAVNNGVQAQDLIAHPRTMRKEERPTWWQITQKMSQKEIRNLQFSPAQDVQHSREFQELLSGVWGNQQQAESFLFLPMKMFNRTTGSLSISSTRRNAYQQEEIQVLETMIQIVTVSLENAKLYERDRQLLRSAQYREEQLAALNSSLQSISSTLHMKELLTNLVKAVAFIVKAEMCLFFEISPDGNELQAKAYYATPSKNSTINDGSGTPSTTLRMDEHDDLIESIHIPFRGTFLETLSSEGFFYLTPEQMDELAQQSEEGGFIFLKETEVQQMLVIPVTYKMRIMGVVAVHTPRDTRIFHPRAVGTLLAICSQAANAIHTAQMFEQREEAYAELEHMSKLKDEFLVTASHELRTPLTAISGYSSQLKRLCQNGRITQPQVERYAGKISDATQQLTEMIENMTQAAKMGAGAVDKRLDMQMRDVQLAPIAEIAVNLLNANGEQQVSSSVPSQIWVHGDAIYIRQVISNLLDNAAKYSPPGSPIQLTATLTTIAEIKHMLPERRSNTQELELEERDNAPIVLVRVQDQGEGIQLEDQQRIFEKFVRAPRSLTTPVRGSGLGLFISRRYIEAMDGWLWLERSEPNQGSIFSFYLPIVEPPQEGKTDNERV